MKERLIRTNPRSPTQANKHEKKSFSGVLDTSISLTKNRHFEDFDWTFLPNTGFMAPVLHLCKIITYSKIKSKLSHNLLPVYW